MCQKMQPKCPKLQHYSLSQQNLCKILQRFYPREDFVYTNNVGMLVRFTYLCQGSASDGCCSPLVGVVVVMVVVMVEVGVVVA